MPPIATGSYGRQASETAADEVRQRTEDAVRTGIDELLAYRAADPASDWARPAGRWIGRKIAAALGGNHPKDP